MLVADPLTGAARTRVTATLTSEVYGRRAPTPEEIAKINALLEARFPSKAEPSAPQTPAPTPEAQAASPVATAATAVAG